MRSAASDSMQKGKRIKITVGSILLASFAICLAGCAPFIFGALGAGTGISISYWARSCVDQILNAPYEPVRRATLFVLHESQIALVEMAPHPRGEKLKASGNQMDLIIDLEVVTASRTRIRVSALEHGWRKKKKAAEEFLDRLEHTLSEKQGGRISHRSVNALIPIAYENRFCKGPGTWNRG